MNTNYFLNLVAGNVFATKVGVALPTKYYLGLSSTAPTVDGVCTGEASTSSTGYSRILLDNLSEPENGVIKNLSALDFPESLSVWGTMKYYVVYDAPTGGNLLFYGELSAPITVDSGTIVTVKAGEFQVKLGTSEA